MNVELTTALNSAEALADKLVAIRCKIDYLQERADQGGMFQHLGPGWKRRYLDALLSLAQARTRQHELALELDVAQRREAAVLASLRHSARLAEAVRL